MCILPYNSYNSAVKPYLYMYVSISWAPSRETVDPKPYALVYWTQIPVLLLFRPSPLRACLVLFVLALGIISLSKQH